MTIVETHIVSELDRTLGYDVLRKVYVLGDEYDLGVKKVYVIEHQGHLTKILLEEFKELQERSI